MIPPVVASRARFTGPYNVCNKYIPLSGSPRLPTLRDVRAESQPGLSSFVSLIFFYWGLSKGERD